MALEKHLTLEDSYIKFPMPLISEEVEGFLDKAQRNLNCFIEYEISDSKKVQLVVRPHFGTVQNSIETYRYMTGYINANFILSHARFTVSKDEKSGKFAGISFYPPAGYYGNESVEKSYNQFIKNFKDEAQKYFSPKKKK